MPFRIRSLTTNERLVYQRIEEAENSGIWLRTITNRVNLHQTVVTKALKDLKSKRLVKEIKSAKFPTKKMYMLFDLEPSEENTGGAFFSEGEMDVGLVEALSGVVTDWVEKQSWAEVSTPVPHSHSHSHHSHHPQKKRKREDGTPAPVAPSLPIADAPKYKQPLSRQRKPLVPHSQSYQFYPTAADILDFIKNCDMLTPSARLRFIDKDVEVLLDMLVYDGRLERMAEDRYRSVRRSFEDAFVGKPGDQEKQREEGMGNGCSDAPCGRCPVFHLCEPGGPVSAENCVYFDEWLKF